MHYWQLHNKACGMCSPRTFMTLRWGWVVHIDRTAGLMDGSSGVQQAVADFQLQQQLCCLAWTEGQVEYVTSTKNWLSMAIYSQIMSLLLSMIWIVKLNFTRYLDLDTKWLTCGWTNSDCAWLQAYCLMFAGGSRLWQIQSHSSTGIQKASYFCISSTPHIWHFELANTARLSR